MTEERLFKQNIKICDRKKIEIDNVLGVCSFEEDFVSIEAQTGRINVEGAGLMIDSLNKESGTIHISGKINSVYYTDNKPKKRFFG